jgi:hypothetical protein
MSSCLSDRALMRVLAELGTLAEDAHLAACALCAARYCRLRGEMDMIRHVLVTTPEPSAPAVAAPRWRVPGLAALSAVVLVSALLWIEVAVWKTIESTSDPEPGQQLADVLANVSSALLSVDGEPASVRASSLLTALDHGSEPDGVCDEAASPESGCASALSGLEETEDPVEVATVEETFFTSGHSEHGGEP